MSLLSFFRKNKQADAGDDSASTSRSEPASQAVRARKRKTAGRDTGDGSSNAPVDPVLPEKKRARRRLVGAVALVLAVVIGLPMVLDSEPKPLADDLTIEIPSKDRLGEPGSARGLGAATSRVPAASALDRKEEMIDVPAPTAAKGAAANPKPSAGALSSAAAAKPTEAVPHANAEPAENKQTRFILQVAAFALPEKVSELRSRLKTAGIASYTQKVATREGERIRIRVGPFDSKPEAERMQAKLGAMGLSGKLLPP